MRRFIIICALAAAASSCRIQEGNPFEPTRLGYDLSYKTVEHINRASDIVQTLMHFNEYLAAEDEEREVLHDLYFYNYRIAERADNRWEIIGYDYTTLSVLTGGHLLDDTGDSWQFYRHSTPVSSDLPTITRMDGGQFDKFALRMYGVFSGPAVYEYSPDLDLAFTFIPSTTASDSRQETYEYIDVEGSGEIALWYTHYQAKSFTFETETPLRTRPINGRISSVIDGALSMRIEMDGTIFTPRAEYDKYGSVKIFGGKDNAYQKSYDNEYRYFYE